MAYLVLARKWRPRTFDDMVGQEHVARILKNAISQNKVAHAYIFSGPRGVGKTSTARILSKALNCSHGPTPEPCGRCASCTAITEGSSIDVSEIDGASNTGVDNIRDLRERVRYAPSEGRYKVYIIDEAHMLSTSAFNALLKTLEEPPPHVIFVLATTEAKKIPPTVLSRCQHLPFRRISGQKIKERLKFIAEQEGIRISSSALDMVARAADGSMRDSLTILDQIVSFAEDISAEDVKDLLGITDVETLVRLTAAVIDGDRKELITAIARLADTGTDFKAFARDLLQFVRNLLIAKVVGDTDEVLELSEEETAAVAGLKEKTSEEHIALILSELIKAEGGIRSAFFPRVALEMALIKLSFLSRFTSIDTALRAIQTGGVEREAGGQGAERPLRPAGSSGISGIGVAGGISGTGKREQTSPSISNASKGSEGRKDDKGDEGKPATESAKGTPKAAAAPESRLPLHEAWNAALEAIDETNHPLACKLRDGSVAFKDTEITLSLAAVHSDAVKENLPLIKRLVEERAGNAVAIGIENAKANGVSRKDLKEKALQNPIIKEALELFEGRIVDVTPLSNKGGDDV